MVVITAIRWGIRLTLMTSEENFVQWLSCKSIDSVEEKSGHGAVIGKDCRLSEMQEKASLLFLFLKARTISKK